MSIYLWNRAMTAWVKDYNKGIATYNIKEAQKFDNNFKFDQDRYMDHEAEEVDHHINNHENTEYRFIPNLCLGKFHVWDNKKTMLTETLIDKRKDTENEGNDLSYVDKLLMSIKKKEPEQAAAANSDFEVKELWFFNCSGYQYTYDSFEEAIEGLRNRGIKEMTHDGWHYVNAYLDYIYIANEFEQEIQHEVKDKDELYQITSKVKAKNFGKVEKFEHDFNSDYIRSTILKQLITFYRNRMDEKGKTGKLHPYEKADIRFKIDIFNKATHSINIGFGLSCHNHGLAWAKGYIKNGSVSYQKAYGFKNDNNEWYFIWKTSDNVKVQNLKEEELDDITVDLDSLMAAKFEMTEEEFLRRNEEYWLTKFSEGYFRKLPRTDSCKGGKKTVKENMEFYKTIYRQAVAGFKVSGDSLLEPEYSHDFVYYGGNDPNYLAIII